MHGHNGNGGGAPVHGEHLQVGEAQQQQHLLALHRRPEHALIRRHSHAPDAIAAAVAALPSGGSKMRPWQLRSGGCAQPRRCPLLRW